MCSRCFVRGAMDWEDEAGTEVSRDTPEVATGEPSVERTRLQELFPDFDFLEKLGEGGMGAVYKARQISLDRLVAIKLLSQTLEGDPEFEVRFQREALAMAMLNHPNIVGIHDFGVRGKFHYFIMEYVEGFDLGHLIRSGKIEEELAFSIIAQVCDALHFAHGKGVVHRDIKPGNIFVDTSGVAKVGDFGLARIARHNKDVGLTMTGVGMGTPSYMAPEQLTDAKAIDARADIYAFGIVSYELLTGNIPAGNFPPPTSRLPRRNKRLDRAILRAMEPDVNARSTNVQDISSAVSAVRSPSHTAVVQPKKTLRYGMWLIAVLALAGGSWFCFKDKPQSGTFPKVFVSGKPQPELLIPEVLPNITDTFAAQRKKGGTLHFWSEKPDILSIKAAEGIDDLIAINVGRYVAGSWYGTRSNGEVISSLLDLHNRFDLRLVTHSFTIEWPNHLMPVEKNNNAFLPLPPGTKKAVAIAQFTDFALIIDPGGSLVWTAKPGWSKSHQPHIKRLEQIADVKSVRSFGKSIVALANNGDFVSWIEPHGFIEKPESSKRIVQIETGGIHLLLLFEDGTVQSICHPNLLKHPRIRPVLTIPDNLGPVVRIKAYDFVNAVQRPDGSWFAWGNDDGRGLIDQINSIGPALDFVFFHVTYTTGAKMIWIAP